MQGSNADHIGRPVVLSVLALAAVAVAAYITASVMTNVAAGVELSVRGVGFPVLLWFLAVVVLALAVMRWVQRSRYVRATTPEQRAAARSKTPPNAHRPGDQLDYGTRLEDSPK